jgi:outer membrane phospholipase A
MRNLKDYKKIIDQGFMSIPAFIEKVHFDKNQPQNHNIYISNMRDDYVIIYDGDDWKLVDKTETINNMYDDNSYSLEIRFNNMMKDLSDYAISKFQRFLDQADDNEIKNNIKKELKLLLYNHRKMVQNTKKRKH